MSVVEDRKPIELASGSRRRMLWIDGVGGFLIVAGNEWLIGGPGASDSVEIKIGGDLSRRAAAIRRQGSDYVLQPLAETRLDSASLERPTLLKDGDLMQFGGSVRMAFRKTHPLSASARLDLVSRHRTEPRSDGIVLLADTCVIGPSKGAHISCPKWDHDVILFVTGGIWQLRSDEQMTMDGSSMGQRFECQAPCRIVGSSVAMFMEAIP